MPTLAPFYKVYSRMILVISVLLYGVFCWANPLLFLKTIIPTVVVVVASAALLMYLLRNKSEEEQRGIAKHIVIAAGAAFFLLTFLFFQYVANSCDMEVGELLRLWF